MKMSHYLGLVLLIATLAFAGCTPSGGDAKEKIYDVKGKVVGIELDKKKVTLDHEEIPGFMKAMTMPFAVDNAKLLEGLKAGDPVRGKLKVKDGNYVLTELMKQ